MIQIFMSYPTRADGRGEISEFKKELEYELQLQTGNTGLRIFQDKEGIQLGEDWRARLSSEIGASSWLMPVVQPLFFASEWCPKEVLEFHEHARARGLGGRILPVLWAQTPQLEDPAGLSVEAASAAKLLESIQRFDWSGVRLKDWSEEKRLRLHALAEEITQVLMGRGPHRAPSVSPKAAAIDPTALAALERLLLSMLSASELRRFLRYRPEGEELSQALPGSNASPAELAAAAVEQLQRRGMIVAGFFEALRGERPRRGEEINAVERLFLPR